MVKSGITRRIDELGRIVIPKEIRKNLKIQDCDEIDISLDGNSIILNKHEINNNDRVINIIICCLSKCINKNVLFTSKEKIVSYHLIDREKIINFDLDNNIIDIINNRKRYEYYGEFSLYSNIECFYIINPLIINGDLLGSLIVYSKDEIKDIDKKIVDYTKIFLENYLE